MNIAVYSPYLDTLGGGERYVLTIAEVLSKQHRVDLLLDSNLSLLNINELKSKIKQRLNLDLSNINCIQAPIGVGNIIDRLMFFRKYDYLFCLTDGSLFYSTSKNSLLHIQSPLPSFANNSPWFKFKQRSWKKVLFNSKFTKQNVEKVLTIPAQVIYPPVDIDALKPTTKKKYILSVGRFFGHLKIKKHELMIDSFKTLYKEKAMNKWSLHLVGSAAEGDFDYVEELKQRSRDLPITLYPNLAFRKLIDLYSQSSIYWHAAGFGEVEPTKMEHFGISTVEAMAAGAVPVVINLGGQKEIVEQGISGFLWDTPKQLEEKSILLIKDNLLMKKMSLEARTRAFLFGKQQFADQINALIV